MRAKYDDDSERVGIRRLLNDYTFLAAFPLHEGSYDKDAPNGFLFDRRLLYLGEYELAVLNPSRF